MLPLCVKEMLLTGSGGEVGTGGDASLTSVTVTMMVWSVVSALVPLPLLARTVTTYWLLLAALEGVVLATSPGFSKSGAVWNVKTPALVMENLAWSAPPWSAKLTVVSAESSSVAVTVITAVWFSSTFLVAEEENLGASLTSWTPMTMVWSAVFSRLPVPEVARTTTRYVLFPAALGGVVLSTSSGFS